jgi:3-isopropylmalate/(R)-2-methylmalate dehydratase large subunit
MGRTLAEKILLAHVDADDLAPGDFVMVRCDVVMANDLCGPLAARELARMGDRFFDPGKIVLVADHFMPAKDTRSAELQKTLKDWARARDVAFYDQGRGGIEHTLLVEEGWIVPGSVVVGSDSHTCTYGALGAFGTGMGATDIAGCMALGSFWQIVPATIVVELSGARTGFVTGKDVILAVIAEIGVAGATNTALEFTGEGAAALSIDERLAVSNMAVEAGADTGLFPADEVTAAYLAGRTERAWTRERSDSDAEVARRVRIDLAGLGPLVAAPHSPGNVVPLGDVLGTRIDQVYIGNCANGTMTDLRQAAAVLRGRVVHERCRAIVVPATQRIYRQALAEGLLDLFVEAGCVVSTPTCGACFGGHSGVLAAGETAITTTNRNFKGRMGSPEAGVYLANAWVAAAAAVAGEIADPSELLDGAEDLGYTGE